MSLTNFESAIKGNMDAYSDTLKVLRNNEVMQRNSALAGLQTEMEKYGELAKIGLEIPMAVEGLKSVGGNVVNRVNQIKDFVGGKVRGVQEAVEEKISGAREGILRQIPRDVENMSRQTGRFENFNVDESKMSNEPQVRYGRGGSVEMKNFGEVKEPEVARFRVGRVATPITTENTNVSNVEELQSRFNNLREPPSIELRTISSNQPTLSGETKEAVASRQDNLRVGETKSDLFSDIASKSESMEESGNGLYSAAKDALSMGTSEEEIGAGLLAIPGIGEVLGGIMEGIGAITEAGAVGAGAYGAVQSMMSADQEEALRQKPLAPIRMPTLDLGGSIGVPLMS